MSDTIDVTVYTSGSEVDLSLASEDERYDVLDSAIRAEALARSNADAALRSDIGDLDDLEFGATNLVDAVNLAYNHGGGGGSGADVTKAYVDQHDNLNKVRIAEVEHLGWSVPDGFPINNAIDSDGKFHQKVGRVDMGTIPFTKASASSLDVGYYFYVSSYSLKKAGRNMLCDLYTTSEYSGLSSVVSHYGSDVDKMMFTSANGGGLYIIDSTYTTSADFRASLNGKYLYFELANEVVYDYGHEYLQGVISDAWNRSTTYDVGDFVIHNNVLYKCTVQNSNQMPPNASYWEQTSVCDELKYILSRI